MLLVRSEAAEFINLSRPEELPALLHLTITGALNVQTRTHKVERRAIWREIEKPNPEIEVPAITGNKDLHRDWSGDF